MMTRGKNALKLIQREKELVKREDELNTLVSEVVTEVNQIRKTLETKVWVNTEKGWAIK